MNLIESGLISDLGRVIIGRRSTTGGKVSKARRRKAKSRRPPTVVGVRGSAADDLQKQLDQRTRERDEARRQLAEALEQQTATSRGAGVISSAPASSTVFETVEKLSRICEAKFGVLNLYEDGAFAVGAMHNVPPAFAEWLQAGPFGRYRRHSVGSCERSEVEPHPRQRPSPTQWAGHHPRRRTIHVLGVPMLKDDELIGAIAIYRQEVRPFTDKQIELVQNFAAQAVIAIENTRLLNELRQRTDDLSESLEQQTATSEVLKVISSSPGELEPVFQAMLENATRICEAKFGMLCSAMDGAFRTVAMRNVPAASPVHRQRGPFRPLPGSTLDRILADKRRFNADVDCRRATSSRSSASRTRRRTDWLACRCSRTNELIGAIVIYRQEVRPFTDKQIELVRTSLRRPSSPSRTRGCSTNCASAPTICQSLEQQTATAEVLKAISGSPGELEPVFHAMLENAVRICEAKFGQSASD